MGAPMLLNALMFALLMAYTNRGYEALGKRLDVGLDAVNKRLDEGLDAVNQRIDGGLDAVNRRIDDQSKRIDDLGKRIDDVRADIHLLTGKIMDLMERRS
jgi:hypothetical protein